MPICDRRERAGATRASRLPFAHPFELQLMYNPPPTLLFGSWYVAIAIGGCCRRRGSFALVEGASKLPSSACYRPRGQDLAIQSGGGG
jgi:hypothetical protein